MFDDDDVDTTTAAGTATGQSFEEIVTAVLSRRRLLKIGGTAASIGFMSALGGQRAAALTAPGRPPGPVPPGATPPPWTPPGAPPPPAALIGFQSVPLPAVAQDSVTVAPGYTARVLFAWGDPVSDGPEFVPDASQTWVEQEQQGGMHHDGIAYFPINHQRGLLCINHEYADIGLLFTDYFNDWTPDKSRKSLAAHGVSVIEVRREEGGIKRSGTWNVKRPSQYARRITGYTPCRVVGPAAGSPYLRTGADPSGTTVLGTLNNCGGAATPWGTYLTGEENYDFYFFQPPATELTVEERRYLQIGLSGAMRVHLGDPRFDMRVEGNRNEPNRFGWMVEIDPFDPRSTPLKLTALGRFKHEMAAVRLTADGRAVAYSGDDERNNYIYKFVGSRTVREARRLRRSPLEEGTLYVARFDAGEVSGDGMGTGEWIPLTPEHPALQGWSIDRILVFSRLAADAVGATRMDRPEWVSVAPDGHVYVALTNNTRRGAATTNPTESNGQFGAFVAPVDEANPRAVNVYGHLVRWLEHGDADATTFAWDIFALADDPSVSGSGNEVLGDEFACPDAVTVDTDGRIWVGTDMFSAEMGVGPYVNLRNNMLLAADPDTREFRRFLVGPAGCEVTGITFTPDNRAMFVDIQHPGEPPTIFTGDISQVLCHWPDGGTSRPRSATLVVTKDDGGVIGT